MNYLIDGLPTEINGVKINTDYRYMVLFEQLLADPSIPQSQKIIQAIDLLYAQPVKDATTAVGGLLWYYGGGVDTKKTEKQTGRKQKQGYNKRIYDFEQDRDAIYAAFMQAYNINLAKQDLHWFEFRALFFNLPGNTHMSKIMGYRAMDISEIKDKDQKKYYEKMKNLYEIKSELQIEKLPLAAIEAQTQKSVDNRFAAAEKWLKEQKNK